MEEPRDGNKCKVGSSTVRRLFTEDANLEMNNECSDKGNEDLNIAGLSYIDSQEPGDLSQANALDFVDRFLKDNLDDLNQEFCLRTTAVGKSASVPSAKGPQLLAANRATSGDTGIFDWDDNMEDEGGGDIFCRRKDDFLKGESLLQSCTQMRKELQGRLDVSKLSSGPLNPQEKTRGLVRSAPPVKFSSRGETGKTMRVRNLNDEFFAESIGEYLRGQTEEICVVGFDTQLAAEAMQALCQEKGLDGKDEREDEELQSLLENGRKKDLKPPFKCTSRFKRRDESDAELRKKSPISLRRSRNTKKCKKKTEVNLREKTLEQSCTDKLDIPCGSRELNNCNSGEKLHEVGKIGGFFTPIAHRTRLSKAASESIRAEIPNDRHKGEIRSAESEGHQVKKYHSRQSVGPEGSGEPVPKHKRSRNEEMGTNSCGKKKTRSSKQKMVIEGLTVQKSVKDSSTEAGRNLSLSAKNVEAEAKVDESPIERSKLSKSACITPTSCPTPSNDASPLCVGNEYFKQSCRKNLSRSSLWKEVKSLLASSEPEPSPASKDTRRKWRDMSDVRVLCSRHLDEETIKQQKKVKY